jgi:hypothetical protein
MATPTPDPALDITPAGPASAACGVPAVVHWQRRLTADEIAVQQQIEQDRRDQATLLADPQLPAPDFPPMPDFLDATTIVPACAQHSISIDAATLIHQATCGAPPVCDCTPEPIPPSDPEPTGPELPPGW